jgi:ketosteroid isomerase-like protein
VWDVQGYAFLFTDNALWMPSNAPDRVGKQEVFKAKGAAFSKFKFSVELTPTEVRALNDEWRLVLCSVRGMLTPTR